MAIGRGVEGAGAGVDVGAGPVAGAVGAGELAGSGALAPALPTIGAEGAFGPVAAFALAVATALALGAGSPIAEASGARGVASSGVVTVGAGEIAGLSEGRLMHAFTESVGIPLRPYLLWLRLQRAAAGIAGGASFVEAAHAAGFTDASHLTRAFARMFGMRPAELRRAIASATT